MPDLSSMPADMERLHALVRDAEKNENIRVPYHAVKPGYPAAELEELEKGLGVRYHPALKEFFLTTGGLSFSWSADPVRWSADIPAEDLQRLTGAIELLDPFEMVMSKNGTRWKDILWFDSMEVGQKEAIRSFVPVDYQSGEMMAGYRLKENVMTDPLCLLDGNGDLTVLPLSFDEYIVHLEKTKGFSYWQMMIRDKGSAAFGRFMKYMPMLFPDFDKEFFK